MQIGIVKQIWRYPVKSMAGEQLQICSVGPAGIPGDRGWALRDETTHEITNGKRLPLIMQCEARYRDEPQCGHTPQVLIQFPDGTQIQSEDKVCDARLSDFLGRSVSLWPLQLPENREHYRRTSKAARWLGRLSKYRPVRAALPILTSFGNANSELRAMFGREPDEPIPDISLLPPEVLEFTSPPGSYFDAFPITLLTSSSLKALQKFNPEALLDVRRFRPNFLIDTVEGIEGPVESEWRGKVLRLGQSTVRCEIPTARCGMTTHAQKNLPKDSSILRTIVRDANQNLGTYANAVAGGEVRVGDAVELL